MIVCNMAIEGGARAGLIAPDDATYQYLFGRPYAPKGKDSMLLSNDGGSYPPIGRHLRQVALARCRQIEPMRTFERNPGHGGERTYSRPGGDRGPTGTGSLAKALRYMALTPVSR